STSHVSNRTSFAPSSALFRALTQKSEAHPLSFQSSPHSLQKHGACLPASFLEGYQQRLDVPTCRRSTFSLSPLKSAHTDEVRVLGEIGRTPAPANPLDSVLTGSPSVTPLESAHTENGGRGLILLSSHPSSAPPGLPAPGCHPAGCHPEGMALHLSPGASDS